LTVTRRGSKKRVKITLASMKNLFFFELFVKYIENGSSIKKRVYTPPHPCENGCKMLAQI
jgi:hypothetical protein